MVSEQNTTSSNKMLVRFMSGTMYTSVGTGIKIVSGVIATKIMATSLPSMDFGYATLIELVANFLAMISGFSIGVAAIRALGSADEEKQRKIVATVVIFQFAAVVIVGIFFLFTQSFIYQLFGDRPVANLAILILMFTLVLTFQSVLKQLLQGFFRFRYMAVVQLGSSIINVLLLALFLIVLKKGLVGAVISNIVAAAVSCIFFYIFMPVKKGLSFSPKILKSLLHFSWPLQLNEILTFTFQSFGTFNVATIMTPADVALLSISGKIPKNVRALYESFRTVYFPNLTNLVMKGDYQAAEMIFNNTLRITTYLLSVATLMVFVFQRELTLLFFSEKYLDVGPVMVFSMFSLVIGLTGNILGNTTVAAGNSMAPTICNVINTVVTLGSNVILVPKFGVMGAVLASFLGRLLTIPMNLFYLKRTGLNTHILQYGKPIFLLGAILAVAWWLNAGSWIERLPFLAIFIIAGFLLSIVSVSDIHFFFGSLNQLLNRRLSRHTT